MARKRKGNPVHGWVVLDKPLALGSTKAVSKVRWLFGAQKAGHAGTLDPLATGLLPIALGEATKTVPFMMDAAKSYEFTITWGANTTTQDVEGEIIATSPNRPTRREIELALPEFRGVIAQVPPKFSAIKVDGKRAYDLARAGEAVELKSREVRIDRFDLVEITNDTASFTVECGKGTYIRSLARDLAASLDACGHVTILRRTRVGPFDISQSFTLDALEELCDRGGVSGTLRPVETALDDIPVLATTEPEVINLKHGRAIDLSSPHSFDPDDWVLAMGPNDQAVALGYVRGGQFSPKRVFQM
ncbi:tRNA pseudouridine(55) synthase TruB [Litorimonas sp. RW-G-Af-16]|uniref:tRNA pseudouridine(55) synthase TruB n=1 Tax=Litorimonas sp. RW-G-Af-16 TaxID=3241168 RepID=UPI00390CB7B6